jgi:lysophospholipase L1-like esterase
MKRLLILCSLFLSVIIAGAQTYNPALHTVTNKALGIAQAVPTDARSYYYDANLFLYRPYQSTAEVLSYLNLSKYRIGHFPIIVNSGTLQSGGTFTGGTVTKYWFKDGVTNSDLVAESANSGGIADTVSRVPVYTNSTIVGNKRFSSDAYFNTAPAFLQGFYFDRGSSASQTITSVATAHRTNTMPDKNGVFAMTSDIPTLKTVGGNSIIGAGDVSITPTLKTVNGNSLLGTGDITISSGGGGGAAGLSATTAIDSNTTNRIVSTNSIVSDSAIASRAILSYGSIMAGDSLESFLDTIVAFGTSVTTGYGLASSLHRYSAILSRALGAYEWNNGLDGSGLDAHFTRLAEIPVYRIGLRYLTFEYGLNDVGTDTTSFKAAYAEIIDNATGKGWPLNKIILIANAAPHQTDVKTIAAQKGVIYANAYAALQAKGGDALRIDGLHPNYRGSIVMADEVLRSIKGQKLGGTIQANTIYVTKQLNVPGQTIFSGDLYLTGQIKNPVTFNSGVKITGDVQIDRQRMILYNGGGTNKYGMGVGPEGHLDIYAGGGIVRFGQLTGTGSTFTSFMNMPSTSSGAVEVNTPFKVLGGTTTLGVLFSTGETYLGGGNNDKQKWLLSSYGGKWGWGVNQSNNFSFDHFAAGGGNYHGFRWGTMNTSDVFSTQMQLMDNGSLNIDNSASGSLVLTQLISKFTVSSTTLGALPVPRVTTAQRDQITQITAVTVTNGGSGYENSGFVVMNDFTYAAFTAIGGVIQSAVVTDVRRRTAPGAAISYVVYKPNFQVSAGTGATFTSTISAIEALEVYNLDTHTKQYFNGTVWKNIITD